LTVCKYGVDKTLLNEPRNQTNLYHIPVNTDVFLKFFSLYILCTGIWHVSCCLPHQHISMCSSLLTQCHLQQQMHWKQTCVLTALNCSFLPWLPSADQRVKYHVI